MTGVAGDGNEAEPSAPYTHSERGPSRHVRLPTSADRRAVVLELRIRAADAQDRDVLHSKLVTAMAQRFAQGGLDSQGSERASFS
jgi:hypothetical protein